VATNDPRPRRIVNGTARVLSSRATCCRFSFSSFFLCLGGRSRRDKPGSNPVIEAMTAVVTGQRIQSEVLISVPVNANHNLINVLEPENPPACRLRIWDIWLKCSLRVMRCRNYPQSRKRALAANPASDERGGCRATALGGGWGWGDLLAPSR
jgi:hypothetical protein